MKNPYVFLELQLGGKRIGRVVIELFADLVPRTAENFRGLCTGEYGDALENRKPLSYVGCKVLKIVPGQYIQCGDFTHNNGTGGESIYGGRFSSENYTLWHAHAGVVSMIPDDRRRNGSQFVITLKKASHLNRQNVVCGQVRNGMDILRAIERIPVDESDRPKIPIFVIGAGQTSRNARSKPGEKSHSAASEGKALLKMLLTENLDGHVAASKKQEEKTEDDVTVMIDSPEEPSVPADSVYKEPNERLSSLMTVLDKCRDLNEMATEEERNNPNGHSDKQMPMGTILPDKPIWSRDERWYLAEPAMTSEARQQREEEKKKHASFAWDVYNARSVFQKYDKDVSKLATSLRQYNMQKKSMGANFYGTDHLAVRAAITSRPNAAGKMQLGTLMEKKERTRRTKMKPQQGDVTWINSRNRDFNEKLEKAFGAYTVVTKQNLERGTAV